MTSLTRLTLPALILFCFLALTACQSETEHSAMGTLERERFLLLSPATESLQTLFVKEGQRVDAGDVLLTLDDATSNTLLMQRTAEREQAQQSLNSLLAGTRPEQLKATQAAIHATQANYQEAVLKHQRAAELYQKKALSKADLDAAKAYRDATAAKVEESQAHWLEQKNGALPETIALAQAKVNAADAALNRQQIAHEQLTLRAPVSGTIDTLPWHVGERVTTGTQLLSLLANTAPYARVYLPATAHASVHVGDSVKVWVDGMDIPFDGRIRHIRSQPAYTPFYALNERDRARLMYLTDIELQDADDLPTGLAVEVRLP